ncbi:HSCB C-terminal oligomerization domain-containing protein [Lophiotrema nucula]|uniref:HSCB C-terminal oligomerization domain-containing protein n=1 Tax=Lophiotrema nucula TaxID=690887 RepID=A0A6A5YRR2_9PLEO|nr:HSCB C-terminal oligomerization domain-containing protein [Lophiotrema nucula]
MPSISPATLSWLRSVATSEAAQTPLRTRQRAATCLASSSRYATSHPSSRRHQSTSSNQHASPPQTHYEFFPKSLPSGPPPTGRFAIDVPSLRKEFLQLQAKAHPDMHSQADKRKAEAMSARINEAFKTLQNPLLRAQYLLSLRGIEVAEDETAKVDDPELLMEVLEAQEQIEDAGSEEDLMEMKTLNDERIEDSVRVLEDAFAKDNVELAKSEAVRLRYWVNIKESLDGWEKFEPVVLKH